LDRDQKKLRPSAQCRRWKIIPSFNQTTTTKSTKNGWWDQKAQRRNRVRRMLTLSIIILSNQREIKSRVLLCSPF